MDDRLQKALEYANYTTTVHQQKQNLKLRLDNTLHYSFNGGSFKATEQLISFVELLLKREIKEVVLLDIRGNPVLITDLESFQDEIIGRYFEATNEYMAEHEKIRKARSVSQVTGVSADDE